MVVVRDTLAMRDSRRVADATTELFNIAAHYYSVPAQLPRIFRPFAPRLLFPSL